MDLIVWVLMILAVVLAVYLFLLRCTAWPILHHFREMGIDSPPASMFLGHMQEGFKYGIWDVQTVFHTMFKHRKVYGWYEFRTPVIVVRDLDLVKDVLVKHFNNFTDRRVQFEFDAPFNENLLTLEGEMWKRVRSAVSPTFSSGRIKKMSRHVDRKVLSLLRVLGEKEESNEQVELRDLMSRFTMDTIASTGFGLDIDTLGEPGGDFDVAAKAVIKPNLVVVFASLMFPWVGKVLRKMGFPVLPKKPMDFFINTVDAALVVRKESEHAGKMHDFLDLVQNLEKEGEHDYKGLSRSEIVAQAILFIFAGFDTVATALSFTLFLLAVHPEHQKHLQEEIDEKMSAENIDDLPSYDTIHGMTFLEQCVNEALRMCPPAPLLERVCTEDVTIQGVNFTKGTPLVIPTYAIHMDPDVWEDPTDFRPQRFDPEVKDSRSQMSFLPFGHGPRNCVGMRLALVELKMAVASVLRRFDVVPCDKTVYPIKLAKTVSQAKDGLWVRLERRKLSK